VTPEQRSQIACGILQSFWNHEGRTLVKNASCFAPLSTFSVGDDRFQVARPIFELVKRQNA
jgi:hypothetical protein